MDKGQGRQSSGIEWLLLLCGAWIVADALATAAVVAFDGSRTATALGVLKLVAGVGLLAAPTRRDLVGWLLTGAGVSAALLEWVLLPG